MGTSGLTNTMLAVVVGLGASIADVTEAMSDAEGTVDKTAVAGRAVRERGGRGGRRVRGGRDGRGGRRPVRAVIVATQLAQVFVAQLVAAVTEFQLLEMRSPTHRSLGEQQLPGQQELQRHHHAHHQSCYRTYT
jgi:hypothetical protein